MSTRPNHPRFAAFASILAALSVTSSPVDAKGAKAAVPPSQKADGASAAGAAYDGRWVIDATTSSFFCPVKSKQLVVTVQGGRVVGLTGLPATASGGVDKTGAVTLNLGLYGVTAKAQGRIDGASGAGAWSADSAICGHGQWSASAAR